MGLDQLSALLAHERRLLGLLLLELERERESLAHDGTPGLGEATRAVEAVVDRLRTVELVRAVAAHDVASSVGLDGDSDLSTIARAVAPPWDAVLEEHRTALTTLAARVAAEGDDARDLLVTAARAVEQQLAGATGGIGAAPR